MFTHPLLATLILTAVIVSLILWFIRKFNKRRQLQNLGALNLLSLIMEVILKLF